MACPYVASRSVCNGGWRNTLRSPSQPPINAHAAPTTSPARAAAAAQPVPPNLGGEWRPGRIQVATADVARTQTLVSRYTSTATVGVAGDSAYLTIPNPDGLPFDEHPFLRNLVADLRAAGIPLRSVVG